MLIRTCWHRSRALLLERRQAPSSTAPGKRSRTRRKGLATAVLDEGTGGDADILVEFESEGVCTRAQAGENIMKVAERCGVFVQHSCLSGSCGTCEMEVTKQESKSSTHGRDQPGERSSTGIVRTCIAAIPAGYDKVVVRQLDDPYWGGGDGWM